MKVSLLPVAVAILVTGCQSVVKEKGTAQTTNETRRRTEVLSLGKVVPNKDAEGISVPRTLKPITIDGQLVESAWRDAAALTDFVIGRSQRPQIETRVLVTYDSDNLYVAVVSEEPNTDKLVATAVGRDGKVWNDDSVEVYVDPGAAKKGAYYGFFVNSKNVIYDRTRDANWSGEWSSATAIVPGWAWVAELAIPFKTLGVNPDSGLKLGLMVARLRRAGLTEDQWMYLVPCESEAKNTAVYPVLQLK